MNKQQQTVLNMAGFIKSQSLTLLEKLDALDADEQAEPPRVSWRVFYL